MLLQIRDKASGILAYIIILLIAIPFALWGIGDYLGGPGDQNVAEVNGEEISKRLFDSQLQNQRRYLQSILGNNFDSLYSDENKLKQNVLDTLIQNVLLGDETDKAGYRVSDVKLTERIQAIPQFQEAGRFSPQRYEQVLASQGRNKAEFETQLRQEESINQYQGSVVYSSFLPEHFKKRYAALKQQKRNFSYLLLSPNPDDIDISDDEIIEYYQANKELFKSLERVKLEYIEITQAAIGDAITFSDDELLESFNDDPDRFQSAELREASHILFKLSEDVSEDDLNAAFDKAKAASQRINNGESFASVAEEVSEDTFSAKNGGDLGLLARNDINNPVFMNKLFAMQVGEVSAPLKTSLGVQIIKLNSITAPTPKPFEEVRALIENELRSEAVDKEFVELAEQLSNLSYVNEDNLIAASEELQIPIQTSEWIVGAELEGIASYPAVVSAAFSEDVLVKGQNSALLEVADGHVVVVRVAEHEPAVIQELDTVRDQVINTLMTDKSRQQLIKQGEEVVEKLSDNTASLDTIAKSLDVEVQDAGALLRDDSSVPNQIVERVFSMTSSNNDFPVFNGSELDDGKYAVIQLNEILEVDAELAKVEQAEWISVEGHYGRREMNAMMKALRETGDVKIFPENLE